MSEVLEAEARTADGMELAMQRIRGELQETTVANRAVHAYHPAQAPDARFSDRKA